MTEQEERLFRRILLLVSLVLLPGYLATGALNLPLRDPLWPRILLTAYSSAVLVLSYRTAAVRRTIHIHSTVYLFLFLFWLLYLTWLNRFSPLLLLWTTMYVFAAHLAFRNIVPLTIFGLAALIITPVVYFFTPDPLIDRTFLSFFLWGGIFSFSISGHLVAVRLGEISERRQIMEQMERSERRLQHAERIARIGYWEREILTGKGFWSEGYYRILGYEPGERESTFDLFRSHIHPDDLEAMDRNNTEMRRNGTIEDRDYRFIRKDGEIRWIRPQSAISEDGRWWFGYIFDITEQVRIEESYRTTIGEKEVLLKEVHHRVKNNLQIVLSLLHLQAGTRKTDTGSLLDAESRIRSMALVHEELYRSSNLSEIGLRRYLEGLIRFLLDAYRRPGTAIRLEIHIDEISLGIEQAIPCGLIVTELVSNALKHAYRDRDRGILRVIGTRENGTVLLTVSDDGPGIPPDRSESMEHSLGISLVQSLAGQLEAEWSMDTREGLTVMLRIPLSDPKEARGAVV